MARIAEIARTTKETDISIKINIDGGANGKGAANIATGVGFFDHMLTALGVHGGFDLDVTCNGDLEVDAHHTVEDVGIVLGQAFKKAIGEAKGIARYGSAYIPMDEALARAVLDISNRPFLVFQADFTADQIGDMDTQLVEEFLRAFAFNAGITLHVTALYGNNDHHIAEAIFKALAHALKVAVAVNGDTVLSTKGSL
ncbi:MAG: imidazoleglycerol-phosphate dehydratase HisB [Clostridiales Family XIII bacterium]|jgi:imidazoleglycerol-phosphate dehydratase|nr:imidazoleglycerol-phosphate dehydratase HisB [Clostridiales Family XIII bacterium]